MSGAHYGTSAYSVGVRVVGSACESEEWASESSVVCRGAAGVGGTRRVAVSAGGQWGTLTAGVSYDAGSVSSVVGDNVASAGSSEVTVSGAHYGTSAYSVGVRVGGSACESEELSLIHI